MKRHLSLLLATTIWSLASGCGSPESLDGPPAADDVWDALSDQHADLPAGDTSVEFDHPPPDDASASPETIPDADFEANDDASSAEQPPDIPLASMPEIPSDSVNNTTPEDLPDHHSGTADVVPAPDVVADLPAAPPQDVTPDVASDTRPDAPPDVPWDLPVDAALDTPPEATPVCEAHCEACSGDTCTRCASGFALDQGNCIEITAPARTWWVLNMITNDLYEVQTTRIAMSEHAWLYLEDGQAMTIERANAILDAFDHEIYPTVRQYFGPEPEPGIDGIHPIMLVYLDIRDGYVPNSSSGYLGGYFWSLNEYSEAIAQMNGLHSNEAEVVFMDTFPSNVESDDALAVLAHEFQHMVHWEAKKGTPATHTFINEGMSMLAEDLCGFGPQEGRLWGLRRTDHRDSLTTWDQTLADYSTAYGYARYVADHFDEEGSLLTAVMTSDALGPECWDEALGEVGATTFDLTFANWAIATVADQDGFLSPYGYRSIRLDALTPFVPGATNPDGPLDALPPRAFEAYYFQADQGDLAWNGAGPGMHASALLGRNDKTIEIVADLEVGQSKNFEGHAWLILANHSDTTTVVGGAVVFSGSGRGTPLPTSERATAFSDAPRRLCGTPDLF